MLSIDHAAHLSRWRQRALAEKALLAFGMLALTLVLPPFPTAPLVALCLLAVTGFGARVPPRLWLRHALAPTGFLLAGVLTLLIEIGPHGFALSPTGLTQAPGLAARAFAGLCCLLFFALTTPMADTLCGLRRIGLPPELTEIALLMYRLVFLLLDTAQAMDTAQAARLGHRTRRHQLHALARLLANLFPRTLDRARRLEAGLAARGWRGELTVLRPVRPVSRRRMALILTLQAGVLACGLAFR